MKFYFDCGLPRSGSTLLTALLNQNPDIYAGVLSPVFEVMYFTDKILQDEPARTFPKPEIFNRMVKNSITEYYSDRNEPVIIDKCRAWPAHINLLKKYINDPKILCTVRHPLDILASFITLFHKDGTHNFTDKAILKAGKSITDDSRCEYLMNPNGIVWESMNALAMAFRGSQTQYIHFIQYDDLVSNPKRTMQGIHSFLNLEPYDYDFNNVVAKDKEKDGVYGLPTMHEVRKEVKKVSKPYTQVLSDAVIDKYNNMDFWNICTNQQTSVN